MNAKTVETTVNAALWAVFQEYVDTDSKLAGLTEETDTLRTARSKHLLEQAKGLGTVEAFDAACEAIANKHKATTKQTQVPRSWTIAASRVRRAMKAGLDLSKFETESSLRKPTSIAEYHTEHKLELPKLPSGEIDWKGAQDAVEKHQDSQSGEGHSLKGLDADVNTSEAVKHLIVKLSKLYESKGPEMVQTVCKTVEDQIDQLLGKVLPSTPTKKPAMEAVVNMK